MKWIIAIKTALAVAKKLRKARKSARIQKRISRHEHMADVLYAELVATAAGDPRPTGN
jgi:hypothetical protein